MRAASFVKSGSVPIGVPSLRLLKAPLDALPVTMSMEPH